MPLLIDTYNVLHTVGILPPELAGNDVQNLVRLLGSSRYRDDRITLVCDGVPPPDQGKPLAGTAEPAAEISIRYSGHGKPADDLIGQLIRASSAPRRLCVVSSDQAVLRAARRRRCKLLTAQEFLQQLADDNRITSEGGDDARAQRPGGVPDKQIERWIKLFNLDEKTLAIPPRAAVTGGPASSRNKTVEQSQTAPALPPPEAPTELPPGPVLPDDVIAE